MQFIFNEDSNLYGYAGGNREFEFPSNIKQMGCIEDGVKIYMEDYVYTYLYQYAKSGNGQEKLAALAGRRMVVDGQEVIIISGAIQGKQTVQDKGVESFSEETWQYINNQMDIYFKGLSLVGWVHTQPGFGAFLMSRDEIFHKEYFPQNWQVLFVIDPLDKLDTFFIHNTERTGLRPAKGYFIYYEKNKEMQEYMMDNSLVRPKVLLEESVGEESESAVLEEETKEKRKPTQEERLDAAKDIRKILKKRAKEAEEESKTKYTVLAGVSSILCLVCLLMGLSMINNVERLKRLETELATVQSSYVTMAQEMANNKTQMVFAAQNAESAKPKEEKKEQPKQEPVAVPKEQQPVEVAKVKKDEMDRYVVEEGDNLGFISKKFYGTSKDVKIIMDANGLDNPDKIICGQELKIPKK